MSDLSWHQKVLQAMSELIKFAAGVDVFIVDTGMIAVAGTGPYQRNIGTKRPRDSYVDVTINKGDDQVVIDPRYTKQCYRCEYRLLCPYTMVMCFPVAANCQVKGMVGFLGFSEQQKRTMVDRSSFFKKIAEAFAYVWKAERIDGERFLSHPNTKAFLDFFDEGLILTSPDYHLINRNHTAEQLLDGRSLAENFWTNAGRAIERKVGCSRAFLKLPTDIKLRGNYPISDGCDLIGHLITVTPREKTHRTSMKCPLNSHSSSQIIGKSVAMVRLNKKASLVAQSDSTILVTGETGTGKEMLARYVHQMSPRRAKPFVAVNCAAIPDSLFESELFGYAPGAFTGADKKGKAGIFRQAHGGTVLLDEVGRLSLVSQAKILRVLEDGMLQRLGDIRGETVDVRVVAATNISLEKAMRENRFLPDLYYRLAVIPLSVPSLRQRVEDIPLLVDYFIEKMNQSLSPVDFLGFSTEVWDFLNSYEWPGNVRELKNVVEYVLNFVRGRKATLHDLPPTIQPCKRLELALKPSRQPTKTLAEVEWDQIRQALQTFGETTAGKRLAARHLGISLSTYLYRRISPHQGRIEMV